MKIELRISFFSHKLEGIALKQRPPKVNMALAKLYQKQGMERFGKLSFNCVFFMHFTKLMKSMFFL